MRERDVVVFNYKYGYFSVIAFLIPFLRWLVTRRFRHEMLRVIREHPAARVDLVSHSFGTHLVGWGLAGLRPEKRPKIGTIIFAGSVLKVGFPVGELFGDGTVRQLVNECGIKDWVLVANQIFVLFSGMAGRLGLTGMTGTHFRNNWYSVGHSGYFTNEFMATRWVPILTSGAQPPDIDERLEGMRHGLAIFFLNNSEPIKLAVYAMPLILVAATYYSLYRSADQARRTAEVARDDETKARLAETEARKTADANAEEALRQKKMALENATEAKRQESIAKSNEAKAIHGRIVNAWQTAAQKSIRDITDHADDDRSALLARQAMLFHNLTPQEPLNLVEQALQEVAQAAPVVHIFSANLHGEVTSIAYSNNGSRLAVAGRQTVLVWDLRGPNSLPIAIKGLQDDESLLAFSPDGNRLAAAGKGKTVRIWDLARPDALPISLSIAPNGGVQELTFSPKGNRLAASAGKAVHIWDVARPSAPPLVLGGLEGGVASVAFSPEGNRLAAAAHDEERVQVWDLDRLSAPPLVFSRLEGGVTSVAFSPNGDLLAASTNRDVVLLWDLGDPTSSPRVLKGDQGPLGEVVFGPDGNHLAAASEAGTVVVWDLHNSDKSLPIRIGKPHPQIMSIPFRFALKGAYLASVSIEDYTNITYRLRNLRKPNNLPRELSLHDPDNFNYSYVALAPDASSLAIVPSFESVRVWDLLKSMERTPGFFLPKRDDGEVKSVAFSPDGHHFADAGLSAPVRVWDLQHLNAGPTQLPTVAKKVWHVANVDGPELAYTPNHFGIYSVAFAPDGNRIATAGWDKSIWIADLRHLDQFPLILEGHQKEINSVAFSADGTHVASASADRTVRVWHLRNPKESPIVFSGHQATVNSVAFSPDGHLIASGSADRTVRVWDLQRPKATPLVLSGHHGEVTSVAFARDGSRLASASFDGTIRVWNLRNPKSPLVLSGHITGVATVAFAPDGIKQFPHRMRGVLKSRRIFWLVEGENSTAVYARDFLASACKTREQLGLFSSRWHPPATP